MTTESATESTWVSQLHPKRRKEFFGLSAASQALVLSRNDRTRRTALRVLDHDRRGINSRERWVSGLEHLGLFTADPNHFFMLAFAGKANEIEAMTDILIDLEMGEHDNVKNTDPLIHNLMLHAQERFKEQGLDRFDAVEMATYFKGHPPRRVLKGKAPTPQDVAHQKAMMLGVAIKQARRSLGLSQAELAQAVGSCEKTIKNMEAGRPVSSHTLLMTQQVVSQAAPLPGALTQPAARSTPAAR